jgi:hypothetical protein
MRRYEKAHVGVIERGPGPANHRDHHRDMDARHLHQRVVPQNIPETLNGMEWETTAGETVTD